MRLLTCSKRAPFLVCAVFVFAACTAPPRQSTGVQTQALVPCNQGDNPIQCENRQPGTLDWKINVAPAERAVEGYASQTSVNQSDVVDLHISATPASGPTTTVEVEVF